MGRIPPVRYNPRMIQVLQTLLGRGEVVFRKPPALDPLQRSLCADVLRDEYAKQSLGWAGEAPTFAPDIAVEVAQAFLWACWFATGQADDSDVVRHVRVNGRASSAGEHLSADLTLRFAPQLVTRVRAGEPKGALMTALEVLLARFPFSGVLADVRREPMTLDFDGHDGLALMYAERWDVHKRDDWRPQNRALEYHEWMEGSP